MLILSKWYGDFSDTLYMSFNICGGMKYNTTFCDMKAECGEVVMF